MKQYRACCYSSRRGFTFIGLILVLIIIAILAGGYFTSTPDAPQGVAKLSLDRSKDVACKVNCQQLHSQIVMWQINHSGEKPTVQALEASQINTRQCPEGGAISVGANGDVYCAKHNPEPAVPPVNVPNAVQTPVIPSPTRAPAAPAPTPRAAAPAPDAGAESIGILGIERAKALTR